MRKTAEATIILFVLILFSSAGMYAEGPDKTTKELKAELEKEVGLTESERKSIDKPVREMLREESSILVLRFRGPVSFSLGS